MIKLVWFISRYLVKAHMKFHGDQDKKEHFTAFVSKYIVVIKNWSPHQFKILT